MTTIDEDVALPEGWEAVRLRDVTAEPTDRNRTLEFDRADVLGVDNETGLAPSDRLLGDDFSRHKLVRRGQFAYNPMRLNVGSIGLWRSEAVRIVSPDYIVFGCRLDRLDPEFMDYFRRSTAWGEQIRRSGQGSVRIRYYYRHIAEFTVPLPPLSEQRAIAQVLRTVQEAKRATEQVFAATTELKQSVLRHLFTYGPVPFEQADKVSLKESEVGEVPEHWETYSLGDIATIERGKFTHRPRDDPAYYGGHTPFIQTGDVARSGGRIDTFFAVPQRAWTERE